MQTFLPYDDFCASARCLDRQRLGKQRVEVLQLLRTLSGESRGWANHPAARMWRNSPYVLADYGTAICSEWRRRGYTDNILPEILKKYACYDSGPSPSWFGDPDFHASHRSNLLRKNPEWYGQFGWSEPPDLPYVWPVA